MQTFRHKKYNILLISSQSNLTLIEINITCFLIKYISFGDHAWISLVKISKEAMICLIP